MKKPIVLRGIVKQDVEASIRSFEKQMALITKSFVAIMRDDIRKDNVDVERFAEDLKVDVSEIAEDFAEAIEIDLDQAIELGLTRNRVSAKRLNTDRWMRVSK